MKRTLAALAFGAVLLVSCSDTSPTGDAGTKSIDDEKADVINFPNTFMNVAHKCDGYGHRVFSHTRNGPPVVIDDPTCKVNK